MTWNKEKREKTIYLTIIATKGHLRSFIGSASVSAWVPQTLYRALPLDSAGGLQSPRPHIPTLLPNPGYALAVVHDGERKGESDSHRNTQ